MASLRKPSALSLWLGAAIIYLVAHALTGRQGLFAFVELQARERALEAQLAILSAERSVLEARAARMHEASLDADYLDERARVSLGAGGGEDFVFTLNH
jgi:cell division protein FtsB